MSRLLNLCVGCMSGRSIKQSDDKLEFLCEQMEDLSVDLADVNANVRAVGKDVSRLREDVESVKKNIETVLENQAMLVALFKEGTARRRRRRRRAVMVQRTLIDTAALSLYRAGAADICDRLDALKAQVEQGFESVISTIQNADAVRVAREFKAKLNSLTLAYNPLVEDVISFAKHGSQGLSDFAREDADKAEMRADDLYSWAQTFVPTGGGQAALSKHAKMELMPYIVAMAYAVRVKLDAHLVRSCVLSDAKRGAYLQRARKIVDDFVRVLQAALAAVVTNTSLVEIALDCYQPIATYVTLMAALRASVDTMLATERGPGSRKIALWDDGLGGIR